MSGRYLMRNTALGACLIFAVLVLLTEVASSQSPEDVSEQGQSIDEGPQTPVVPSGIQESTTDQSQLPQAEENQVGNNTGKQNPTNEGTEEPVGTSSDIAPAKPISDKLEGNTQPEESGKLKQSLFQWSDMAAQWIMAVSGVVAVMISVWAVCLLRSTLTATRAAVDEAEKGTKAAQDIAKQSEIAAKAATRPYLFIKILSTKELKQPDNDFPAGIIFTLFNYGKTPAILLSTSIEMLDSPETPLRKSMASHTKCFEVIGPGEALAEGLTLRVKNGVVGKQYRGANAVNLILYGIINYVDPTRAHHTDSICMRAKSDGNGFQIEGGDEHNWHHTERPDETIDEC